ncbi:MAG: ATPase [Ruminococcaceae bacterium]|nr:ATPase [Oscillospiraceae bacterium]
MDIDQILKKAAKKQETQGDKIFALDIGTRTVVGIIGEKADEKYRILDCVVVPHTRRAMVDGQIEDIKQVAKIVGQVKQKLEQRNGITLTRASIAAAGRALKTVNVSKEFDVSGSDIITEEMVASMEMETVSAAQTELDESLANEKTLFYCVGHNVVTYRLDDYKMISLNGHKGATAGIDMVVAFLPGIVVESLYSVMELNKLEVQSLTLEPIAAMNVIIPPEIRLINIALVDIGAGTSDIAIAKDGSIIAYAMATVAGDEITEEIIRSFLVDFAVAEQMKHDAAENEVITYKDIFGIPHEATQEEFIEKILPCMDNLAATICDTIIKINGESPQAVFLVGGGSLIKGLPTLVADKLDIDEDRVAVGGGEFLRDVDTGDFNMGAEFITPIGIGVTALEDRGYDFSVITVNGKKIRVFDTKKLTVYQVLSLAGYKAGDIMGHSGQGLAFTVNGNKVFRKGSMMTPSEIKINGNSAGLTSIVTQGDNVELIPAKNGDNARAVLKNEINYRKYHSGTVSFGDKQYKFGIEAFVNGVKKPPQYEIQPLDEIVTGGILTLGDLLNSIGVEYTEGFAINGEYAEEFALLSDGDVITLRLAPVGKKAVKAETEIAADEEAYESYVSESVRSQAVQASAPAAAKPVTAPVPVHTPAPAPVSAPAQSAASVAAPEIPRTESSPAYSKSDTSPYVPYAENLSASDKKAEEEENQGDVIPALTLMLNGRPLTLPEKRDGIPHTFLELLNHVDIDTRNPMGRDIELTLNGSEINFGEELHDGDRAVVKWKE